MNEDEFLREEVARLRGAVQEQADKLLEQADKLAVGLPEVERAVVYTPQPGDRVVLEVSGRAARSPESMSLLRDKAKEAFGHDVQIIVLTDVTFAGVVRD